MDIGKTKKVERIELPRREREWTTAPATPKRKPLRRVADPAPVREPVKAPEKV